MKRILVIEDDPDHRTLLEIVLENAGYEIIEAPDGETGLRLFRQEPCDLVITDIFMPGIMGEEVILKLKQISPQVKIIAISGGGIWSGRRYIEPYAPLLIAKNFGADCTMNKPIKIEPLLKKVDELLHENDQ